MVKTFWKWDFKMHSHLGFLQPTLRGSLIKLKTFPFRCKVINRSKSLCNRVDELIWFHISLSGQCLLRFGRMSTVMCCLSFIWTTKRNKFWVILDVSYWGNEISETYKFLMLNACFIERNTDFIYSCQYA